MQVGTYPAGVGPYGAMDMAGNVWEWVLDRYGPYDKTERNNPEGPASGYNRVLRGGSWLNEDRLIRTSSRSYSNPDYSSIGIGFRCAFPQP